MNAFKPFLAAVVLTMSLTAGAAVRLPPDGVTLDSTRAAFRRGAETLRPIRIDRRWVEESAELGGLWLPSTGPAPILARYARSMRSRDGNWTWVGKVDTRIGEQSVILTFGDHAVFGLIPQPSGYPLRIETRRGQSWLVEGMLPPKILPHGQSDGLIAPMTKTLSKTTSVVGQSSGGIAHTTSASSPMVDVLVAYTPSVVTYYGSDSAARTRISFLESLANQAYVDSQADIQIRVVAKQLLNYTAVTDNNTLLNLITTPSADPVKTQIDTWRSQYGADLVSVVRAFDNASQPDCGLAWIGGYHGSPYDSTHGFSAVGDGANGGFYCTDQTFAHELGHNMGSQHDYTTASGDYGAYTYSRGYRQTIDANTGFATVMAYSEDPQVVLSIFSNPNLNNCMGQPCGVADADSHAADNAHTLSNSAPAISAYVATTVPTLSIADVSITEGNSGTKLMTFTVTMSAASASAVTYDIATANGTATAGSDYVASTLTGQSIAAGVTSKTFAVTIDGDTTIEPDETFTVNLSNASGATIADAQATGTISNDDVALPSLSIGDVSISEGNSGTKVMTFTVNLSAASASAVTYDIATANGTATAGSDYVASTLTGQSIAAGVLSKTFAVTINGDTTIEPNETFTVNLSNAAGATLADAQAVGTISNDDVPSLSIGDVSISEGNSGTKVATFTVSLSQAAVTAVTYSIATANGTATAGSDYVASTLTGQSIAAGVLSKTFAVTIDGDATIEPDETFTVTLSAASGATLADAQATGTISNDDGPSLSIADVALTEGNAGTQVMTFTVKLSSAAATAVTYSIATANGTATAGSDYVASTLTGQSIAAGVLSKTFAVTINGDATAEANETFTVNLSSASGAFIADAQALGTITNDDGPTLSINSGPMSEGNSGTKAMTFTVSLSQVAAVPVTYTVFTAYGTATPGVDYIASNQTGQTIPAGQLSKSFTVVVNGDTTVEPNETFLVNLSNSTGASIAKPQGVATIINDDGPTLSIGDMTVAEGNAGTKTLTFTVALSQAAATAVTYDIATANNTATAGSDYVASSLSGQSIPAGVLSKTFVVTIDGDATVEPNETFFVNLGNATGATIADAQAVGLIANDDGPTLSVNNVSTSEGNAGTKTLTFTVSLSQAAATAVTYSIFTSYGTATAGTDYLASSLTGQSIAAGVLSKTFSVTINGDTTIEPNETFLANLSNATGASIYKPQGVGTITNDD